MNAIIIEDEPLAAVNLSGMIEKLDHSIEIIQVIDSVKESVEWLRNNIVDVIFMDIRLTDGLSFAIFDQINVDTPVIFTTAYDHYAIDVFEQNSVDYLLKPVKEEELERALKKLKNLFEYYGQHNIRSILDYSELKLQKEYKERFLLRIGQKMKYIPVDSIDFFYSSDGDTELFTLNNKAYPIEESLDKLEKSLDPNLFFRVNRRFLIHINSIDEMSVLSNRSIKVILKRKPMEECIVSINRLNKFKRWLNQ